LIVFSTHARRRGSAKLRSLSRFLSSASRDWTASRRNRGRFSRPRTPGGPHERTWWRYASRLSPEQRGFECGQPLRSPQSPCSKTLKGVQACRTQTGLCRHSNRSLFAGANSAGKRFGEARDRSGVFHDTCRTPGCRDRAIPHLGRQSRGSQRLFRLRRETGIAQDCVVVLVGLERMATRLFEPPYSQIARAHRHL
jgi:hypothetical protein